LATVRPRLIWPVIIAAAALIGLLAYGVTSKGRSTTLDQAVVRGDRLPAPARALPRLGAGGERSLADYKGKVVVLNVWASWCDPCREEMPLLERTQRRIAGQGATVLGVDTQDASDSALAFLRQRGITFPSVRDRDRSYGRELGVTGYPETFLIDRRGRVAALRRFPVTQAWLDRHLPPLLAESA
jgi:cytochrome c biogenesis protein CcmG/thiol:disulfide interchange protein DsbE